MGIITNVRDTSDCSNQQKPKSPTTDDQHQLDMIKRNFALSETPGRKNGQAVRLHDCWNFNTIFSPQPTREARYVRTLIRAARGLGDERFLFGQKRRLPATDQKFPGLFLLPGGGEHQTVVDRNGGITQLIATQAVHGI